jgi:predicted permease
MRALRIVWQRLRSLFHKGQVEDDLDREVALHLEALAREHMAAGLDRPAALAAARREFGSPALVKDTCRDKRRVTLIEDLFRDLSYAVRLFARSPAFAVTALLSLALGMGANVGIFSLVDAVLLRQLAVSRPNELVSLTVVGTEGRAGAPPYPVFERLRRETSAFSSMAAFADDELRVEVDGQIEQVTGQVVSGGYFDLLGLQPAAGRLMTAVDDELSPPVAVIGWSYWQRRFGQSPDVIGRTISYRGRAHTVIGVTPRSFSGLQPGRRVDVMFPITLERELLRNTGAYWFDIVARLAPGADRMRAATEADAIFQSFITEPGRDVTLRREYFDHVEVESASRGTDRLRSRFSLPLYVLMSVAVLVLLVACANLANLLLVRGVVREHEFAVRLAIGAGRGRVLRQVVTESLFLFALGTLASLPVGAAVVRGLTAAFAIGRNPIVLDTGIDWKMAGVAALVGLAAATITGLWPAQRILAASPRRTTLTSDPRVIGSRASGHAGRWILAVQVALSFALVLAAVVFGRTIINLRSLDLGFAHRGIVTMSIDPVLTGDAAELRPEFWRSVIGRVSVRPGVDAVSLSVLTPLSGRDTGKIVTVSGFQPRTKQDQIVHLNHVSEDYFRTFRIQLQSGRVFSAADAAGAHRVAIVNESSARAYFAGRNPIGQTITFGDNRTYEIVGVVRDAKHRTLREPNERFVFVPLWQPVDSLTRVSLAVSSSESLAAVTRMVADDVRQVHSATLISDILSVDDQIDATLVSERLLSELSIAFAALAVALAAVGLYGVLSYSVLQRRSEFGLRLTLGASRAHIVGTSIRAVLPQVVVGIAVGAVVAVMGARHASPLLFGVEPSDPLNYATSAGVLGVVVAAALWSPVRRAIRINPSEALKGS